MSKFFSSMFCIFVLMSVSLAGCITDDALTVDGSERIIDINPDGDSDPKIYGQVGGFVLFSANDSVHGRELWRTSGVELTTEMVADIYVGAGSGIGQGDLILGDHLYFLAKPSGSGYCEIYRSDGTDSGLEKLTEDLDLHCSGTRFMEALDDDRIVIANLGNMYVLDINTLTVQVVIVDAGTRLLQFGVVDTNNDLMYFLKQSEIYGLEPWVSDGTVSGTHMLKDIESGSGHSKPSDFVVANNIVYFIAEDDENGRELWKTDGTNSGTVRVTNWETCDGDARKGVANLWESSSSHPAASMVVGKESGPLSASPTMGRAAVTTDVLFFIGNKRHNCDSDSPGSYHGMLRSDGTHEGTYTVYVQPGLGRLIASEDGKSIYPIREGYGSSFKKYSVNSNVTETVAEELEFHYYTRATIQSGQFCEIDGVIYISMMDESGDSDTGYELWATDGTSDGTMMISDINPGSGGSNPESFYCTSRTVYFSAEGEGGRELWKHRP